jgi:tetratricopeptide (TPR) repeat protein
MADMLALESDVAQEIAHEVQVQLTPEETARVTSGARVIPAAQQEYLLGSYYRWRLKDADLKQAIDHFRRSIEIQSDFAAGYASLSGALAELGSLDSVAPARDAAKRALELDPQLSEAHSALARMSMTYDWDWASAEQEFKRALELDPNSLEVCQCYPDLLATMGRFSEATAILDRGAAVNPLSSAIQTALGRVKLWGRQTEAAKLHLQKAVEIDPQNALAYLYSGELYEVTRDLPKALTATEQFLRLRGVNPENSPLVARIYTKLGRHADAARVLANLTKPGSSPNFRDLATVYFALGDKDHGFEALTKAFDLRQDVPRVNVSALYDDVRGDERFKTLVARLRFPERR